MVGDPYDGVSMEIFCGIEPEIELLLSVPFALSEDIGVDNVRVTGEVSQELEVNLIMCWPVRRQVISGNSASRVSSNKFELHINPPKQVLFLGSKSGARGLV